ncbi:serine hydrolase domain-containing protein [Thaumasiovibrio subtropicus]|uniref:serine hydrolase domain-containing protein n=1 Tax=Thaumasiovibrio subtropicus TaxID=1891207 RepID=UPI000B350F6A|nr:serine hydrolase [Thaumasiovibrio subtropicus]
MKSLLTTFLLLFIGFPCLANESTFRFGTPSDVGLSHDSFQQLDDALDKESHRLHALLVVKDGVLAYERYFDDEFTMVGYEQYQYVNHDAQQPHLLFSSTKSVMSILAGVALQQGFIDSTEKPIVELLPEYAGLMQGSAKSMTLQHALDMAIGIDFDEWQAVENGASRLQAGHPWYDFSHIAEKDRMAFIFNRGMRYAPGETFQYSGAAVELTAKSIEAATKMRLDAFASQYLFNPLGITTNTWLQRAGGGIAYDWGLSLTARDFAKLGQLYLNQGEWNGAQLVDKQWIEESYDAAFLNVSSGMSYSRYWYHPFFRLRPESIFQRVFADPVWIPALMSHGYGNQILFIFPEQEMIVVMFAGEWLHKPNLTWHSPLKIQKIMAAPFKLVADYILPAALGKEIEFVSKNQK